MSRKKNDERKYLLDEYPWVESAFSLRKLSKDTEPVIVVAYDQSGHGNNLMTESEFPDEPKDEDAS